MYLKKFLYNSVFNFSFTRPNLNVKNACSDQNVIKCLGAIHNIPLLEISDKMNNLFTKVKFFYKNGDLYEVLAKCLHLTESKLKNHSTIIIRAWTRQCEYIVAQRFRRTQQMFCLYTQLWEERALKELIKRMQQQVTKRGKEFVFGAIGITGFNWERHKISDEEIYKHVSEFDYINLLKEQTIHCKHCHQRRLVDIMLPDMTYCKCNSNNSDEYVFDDWVPFLERQDLLVWRRQRSTGSYEYKLYGMYNDVTAEDFLKVQVDTEYRQCWDTTAINLFVIDTDMSTNSDVIYWEMLWPRMFSNRDYVYNRRYVIDAEKKIVTIISKSIEHPACPVKPDKHRVSDYESCMVIRSNSELNQPGIEFCLTYYDEPGVNIPAAVTSWVAIAGMPDFLNKLRNAAKEYRGSNENNTSTFPKDAEKDDDRFTNVPNKLPSNSGEDSAHQVTNNSETDSGYWRYIHPYYFLG